jgi:NitT/TauT family transport system substrate-binding protein
MTSIRLFPVLLLGLTVAVGCDNSASTTRNTSSSNSSAGADPAHVRVGYFANLTHAQAVLGVASKDFENAVAPARVSTKVFNAGPSLIEALFAGEIDIGYVGPGPALNAFAKSRGQGIRVLAGAAANGVLIVARKDSGIRTLQDLKGKRLATPQLANTQDIAAKFYLTHELGQKDFSNVIPVPNAEQAAMMSNGQVDAAWAPEPWGSFLVAQAGATVVGREKDLWPQKNFSITVVVTTPEFLQKHPATVEKLLGVHRTWTERLTKEPATYVPQLKAALFDLTKKQLPEGVVESALATTSFTDEPLPHTFETMAVWSYELGYSREKTDTSGLIDTTILRKLQAAPAGAGAPGAHPPAAKEGA